MTGTITLVTRERPSVKFDTDEPDTVKDAEAFFTMHTKRGAMAFDAKTQERITRRGMTESKETLLVPAFVGG